jgi:Tol biopolymer transport system component
LSQPVWAPDGRSIYYVREAFTQQAEVAGQVRQVERRDLATGERTVVAQDGLWPSVSPDGSLLVYVQLSAAGRSELLVRNLASDMPQQLTGGQFAAITSPRFSPDGRTIAFGGAPFSQLRQPAPRTDSPGGSLLAWLSPPAFAHELLAGLWLMDLDGSHLREVGTFKLDGPLVRWASDSNRLLLYDEDGLYRVDVERGQLTVILKPGSYRGFDWLPAG